MASKAAAKKQNKKSESFTKTDALKWYKDMLLIRRFEEKAAQLYGMGLIGGFCHLYIGQEAVVVGLQSVVNDDDDVITTYRDHGHMLAAGTDPKYVYAELMGRVDGVSKGKGGSMHMFDTANHFWGGHGIVGANVPLGAGIAFANQYKENGRICLTYFGDGAANQGQVYETFNMAALWKLPVIFVIENNEYAMGTSVKRSSSNTEMYQRGASFGIEGRQVDGMDITKVREAGKEAAEYVRSGKGPIILEMKTYRYRGHSMSDPAKYRSKEEVTDIKEHRDPINTLRRIMEEQKMGKDEDFKKLDKEIRDQIAAAVEFSKESPEPDAAELFTDIYKEDK